MDTDYPVVPIRRYLDAVEDMAVPSRRTQGTNRAYTRPPLSPFEQLPLEIRQEIYGWLGFPVAGKLWKYILTKRGRMRVRSTIRYFRFPRWDLTPEGSHDVKFATDHPAIDRDWDRAEQVSNTRVCRVLLRLYSDLGGYPNCCPSRRAFVVKLGTRCSRAPT